MFINFDSIITRVRESGVRKTAAVAAAHDKGLLSSAAAARKLGIMDFTLVGDKTKIRAILDSLDEKPADWEIMDEDDETAAAAAVARMVSEKKADMPLKGMLHTSVFLRALLSKETGFLEGGALLSQAVIFENTAEKRLTLITDCVINISPGYSEKMKIISNAVSLCHRLGVKRPKVAVLAAVETVNPDMPECVEAAMLSKACERGQIKGCEIDGPLALDLAVSKEAAEMKGVSGSVAGDADILLVPNLVSGNILDKSVRCLAGFQTASAILGANVPFIATSRSDSQRNRLNTMAVSVLQSLDPASVRA